MTDRRRIALALGLWLLLGASVAHAQDAASLTQTGVPAEATAENGVLAREQALANGRRAAWERLVAAVGGSPGTLSDRQIEGLVNSIVIEQERPGPTRYSGRITVNFSAGRVRGVLGGRTPGADGWAVVAGTPSPTGPTSTTPAATPAAAWVVASADYRSLTEWLELRRRLTAAPPVATVDVQAIAVDGARLRLGLRAPPAAAVGELAAAGVTLSAGGAPGVELWRVGLARGG